MESELQSQTDSQTALEAKFEKLVGSQREQSTPRQTLKCTLKTSLCIWSGLSAPVEQPGLGFTQLWYSGNELKSFLQWKILMLKLTAPLTPMFSKTIVYLVTEGGGRNVHVMVYHRHWDGYSNVFYVLLMHVDFKLILLFSCVLSYAWKTVCSISKRMCFSLYAALEDSPPCQSHFVYPNSNNDW